MATTPESMLFSMLMQTGIGTKDPELFQYLRNEIGSNEQYMDHLRQNPSDFAARFMNARFLEMLASKYVANKKKKDQEYQKSDIDESRGRRRRGDDTEMIDYNDRDRDRDRDRDQDDQRDNTNHDTDSWLSSVKGSISSNNNSGSGQVSINENVLPEMDNVYFLIYNLSLSLQYDLVVFDSENLQSPSYEVRFVKYGNISKIVISSFVFKRCHLLDEIPYIYVKFDEITGRCYTSKKTAYFGKLILKEKYENDYQYIPDSGTCIQTFSSPIELDRLTVSFYDPKGALLSLQDIIVEKKEIFPKSNKIKLTFLENHELYHNEHLIIRTETSATDLTEYEIAEYEIIDNKTIQIDTKINKIILNDAFYVYRKYLNCHMTINLYEINRMLINGSDRNSQNLIKLTNIIRKLESGDVPPPARYAR